MNSKCSYCVKLMAVSMVTTILLPSYGQSQTTPMREYGLRISGNVNRSWDQQSGDPTVTSDFIGVSTSILFVNDHLHYGILASVSRYRSDNYGGRTSYSLGGQIKYTLNDLGDTMATPYVVFNLASSMSNGENYESHSDYMAIAAGYEFFINEYVSLQTELEFHKNWNLSDYSSAEYTGRQSSLYINFGLGLYI